MKAHTEHTHDAPAALALVHSTASPSSLYSYYAYSYGYTTPGA